MSQLLTYRPKDRSKEGLTNWRFNSVHFWGEPTIGDWHLFIVDSSNKRQTENADGNVSPEGTLGEVKLFLHGTETIPEIQKIALNEKTLDSQDERDYLDLVSSGIEWTKISFHITFPHCLVLLTMAAIGNYSTLCIR